MVLIQPPFFVPVQNEVSPWIRTLVPTQGLPSSLHPGVIPYTTTPQGIGQRTVLEEAWSEINGPIVVEDVELLEPGELQPTTFRRMVFLDSPGLIQSEAVLVHTEREIVLTEWELDSTELEVRSIQQEGHKASDILGLNPEYNDGFNGIERETINKKTQAAEREHRKGVKRTVGRDTNSPDHRKGSRADSNKIETGHRKRARRKDGDAPGYLGESDTSFERDPRGMGLLGGRHCSVLVSRGTSRGAKFLSEEDGAKSPKKRGLGTKGLTVVDFSYLASKYLQAMVAGLSFLGPVLEQQTESGGVLDVLVIGLGGGGMPMFLRHHLPCSVKVSVQGYLVGLVTWLISCRSLCAGFCPALRRLVQTKLLKTM
jgi:hypothetical protein